MKWRMCLFLLRIYFYLFSPQRTGSLKSCIKPPQSYLKSQKIEIKFNGVFINFAKFTGNMDLCSSISFIKFIFFMFFFRSILIFPLKILYCIYIVVLISEAYSEPCQLSKMEFFAKIFNGLKLLTVFAKISILDIW